MSREFMNERRKSVDNRHTVVEMTESGERLTADRKAEVLMRLRQEKSDEIKAKMQKFSDDMKNRFEELKAKFENKK